MLILREYPYGIFEKKTDIKAEATQSIDNLLTSLKSGDHAAMEFIYQNYWEMVLDTAYKRLRDEDIAQDISQEIFISLWENRAGLQIDSSLEAWLKGAVKYKVINYFKSSIAKEKHEDDIIRLLGNQHQTSAESSLILKDLNKQLDEAMEELPEKMRLIFSMSRKQEKSIQEIGDELNLSAQTVKNQISAALKMVRKKLSYTLLLIICLLLTQA
ncbi:RNA polymerase sigma-70 factor [Pedobacter sp. MC2016-14]|uniref:RNA polymerase sigma factor n=1 Tax=Pedobacter sp. MC2016-14 TaxID=2897327 RepID=UPI001E5C4AB5|nr:RNA polymerase sigma-70 factor [Pedobacter sp. MC2016-14]MCD0488300.1 RNA polymerase sigma-70 factor [Pedobacter sp. MC2016-14]